MDDFKTILKGVTFADGSNLSDGMIEEIKAAVHRAGYIKLPNNQNITVTTSDNPNDKLMTREQWEAERG